MPRRAVFALLGAAAAVGLLILTWFLAFHVGIAQRADQSIYNGFGNLGQHPRVGSLATFIARLCNPSPYVYLAAVPVAVALVRRRVWVGVAIGAILLGANVTTQLLKPLLAAPRAADLLAGVKPVSPASWPSGHATAAHGTGAVLRTRRAGSAAAAGGHPRGGLRRRGELLVSVPGVALPE